MAAALKSSVGFTRSHPRSNRLRNRSVHEQCLILLAAGQGTRTGEPVAKQFLDLGGKPVLIHAIEPFARLPFIGRRIVVAATQSIPLVKSLLRQHGIADCHVISGGETRQDSVRLALEHVRTKRVITHNASLPFVTEQQIKNVADKNDACVTTVTDMVYSLCRGRDYATELIDMKDLKLINTPQSFDTAIFRECHRRAFDEKLCVKSDCELMMKYHHDVRFVRGEPSNFKITTSLDFLLAEALLQRRRQASD